MINVGDVVRTKTPIDGYIRGGIVIILEDSCDLCTIRSGGEEILCSTFDLVKATSMPAALSALEKAYFNLLNFGEYKSYDNKVEIPQELFDLIGDIASKARYPTGVPWSTPLVVLQEEVDDADNWKLGD